MSEKRNREDLKNETLIQATIDGDTDAFRELVMKYKTDVAKTIYGMLGDCPEADDVGQETFLRFYKSIGSFRGESSLKTYLTRIAINLSLNELKRRKRRALFFLNTESSVLENISSENMELEQNETRELVRYSIQRLNPQYRAVIVLRLIDGYSTKETAEILNIPEGTVLSRLARAQKKLKVFCQV